MEKELKVIYWILAAFMVYLIIEIVRKLVGGSLGFEELVIGLLVANLGYSFYLQESVNKIDTKLSTHLGWHQAKEGEGTASIKGLWKGAKVTEEEIQEAKIK